MATEKQTDAESIEQLNTLAASYIKRPTFKPGDLVLRSPASLSVGSRRPSARSVAIVMETVESLRDFMDEKTLYPGQGLLICCTDSNGEMQIGWLGAWLYEPAPSDLIAGFAGHRSH
jgi:hypothetical protein